MPRIGGCLGGIAAERHQQWSIERDGDPLQRVKVKVADAAFDSSDHHATQPRARRKLDSSPSPTLTHGLDLSADTHPLFTAAPVGFDRESGSPDAGHDRAMFNRRPSLTLSCGAVEDEVDS